MKRKFNKIALYATFDNLSGKDRNCTIDKALSTFNITKAEANRYYDDWKKGIYERRTFSTKCSVWAKGR
jgi:hypothetical protein